MDERRERLRRREVLAGLAGAALTGLAGCSAGTDPTPSPSSGTPGRTGTLVPSPPTPTSSRPPPSPSVTRTPLPTPVPWRPAPRDAAPQAKLAAVRALVAAGTWGPGTPGAVGARLRGLRIDGRARRALERSGIATGASEAVAQVRVAQLGGLLPDSASVMVVLEQQTPAGARDRTYDVRLRRRGGWTVSDVLPARPGPPLPRNALSETARRALATRALRLPADARADIASGEEDDRLLRLLVRLAADHDLDVTVLRSGHPYRIFDKPQVSDHSRGRAADIWAIDGRPVIEDSHDRVVAFMRRAAELGAYQVGGPWDPSHRRRRTTRTRSISTTCTSVSRPEAAAAGAPPVAGPADARNTGGPEQRGTGTAMREAGMSEQHAETPGSVAETLAGQAKDVAEEGWQGRPPAEQQDADPGRPDADDGADS